MASRWRGAGSGKRNKVYYRYGKKCFLRGTYCTGKAETLDHWKPRANGGGDRVSNLRPACIACNQEKGDMTPEQWARWTGISLEEFHRSWAG